MEKNDELRTKIVNVINELKNGVTILTGRIQAYEHVLDMMKETEIESKEPEKSNKK